MFDLSPRETRREIPDLNVVPILDMLISVIFFLILTTTFLQLTKESVPPSSVSTITNPVTPPPVSAKMVCVQKDDKTIIILSWAGAKPGQLQKEVDTKDPYADESRDGVLKATQDMIGQFSEKFPNEKTLQLGFGAGVPYQELITIMDGAKDKLPDVVLFDYQEAELRAKKALD